MPQMDLQTHTHPEMSNDNTPLFAWGVKSYISYDGIVIFCFQCESEGPSGMSFF